MPEFLIKFDKDVLRIWYKDRNGIEEFDELNFEAQLGTLIWEAFEIYYINLIFEKVELGFYISTFIWSINGFMWLALMIALHHH